MAIGRPRVVLAHELVQADGRAGVSEVGRLSKI